MWRLSSVRLAAAAGLLALASCAGLPDLGHWVDLTVAAPVPGLPAGAWVSLPLRAWVGRDGIEARAISACPAVDCPSRLAVAQFRATGAEARRLSALLDDPRRLAMEAAARPDNPARKTAKPPRVVFSSAPLEISGRRGFVASLARIDGTRPAYVAVLASERRDPLDLVLAVGADREATRLAAEQAGRAALP